MNEIDFYKNLGFDENPFQFTNADDEMRLSEYFVPPPYFTNVVGNPDRPNSTVIFAPRGGGKSAQRRMIELEAEKLKILCVTYDRFEFLDSMSLENITLSYHLGNIIKRVLLGLLYKIDDLSLSSINFTSEEKQFMSSICQEYLGQMTEPELVSAIKSLRGIEDKIKSFTNDFLKPLSPLINLILTTKGIPGVNFVSSEPQTAKLDHSQKYNLGLLGKIANSLGYKSVYVLIDKVDETQSTGNDSEASYKLIEPLLRDIELLSTPNFGIKFFLWDEIKPYHIKNARPDRVQQFELNWEVEKIEEALIKRLSVYSHGSISGLSQITSEENPGFTTMLVLFFANNSPRDVIRLCREICSQQIEINSNSTKISDEAIEQGIKIYCTNRVDELIIDETKLREFKKLRRLDFTINYVANEIFKIDSSAANSKIKGWQNSGWVKKIGEKRIKGSNRPSYHYAITDVRLARVIFGEMDLYDFVINKVQRCNRCNTVVLRDWDLSNEHTCHNCTQSISKELN